MSSSNAIKFDRVSIDWLKPSVHQSRVHNRLQRRKLQRLLQQFGQVRPLVAASNGEIVDGHAVWEALKELGKTEVDVVIVANQSDTGLRALRLALNRLASDTRWDKPRLKQEIQFLLEVGYDVELTAFDSIEIDMVLSSDAPEANLFEDAASIPPRPRDPTARIGDIFQLGSSHVIGCGDACDLDFVHRVRGERLASCCIVDFAHALPTRFFAGRSRHKHPNFVQGAGEMSASQFFEFLRNAMRVLQSSSSASALLYAFMDWRHILEITAAARSCDLPMLNLCVWSKTNAGMGSLYRSQHELIFLFKLGCEPHKNNIELGRYGRSRSNIWEYPGISSFGASRDELRALHPSVKPVRLIADAIRDVTKRGDVILDTFLGSGSTLIAAEETGRACVGVELDAASVDVAIQRWQNATGRDAIHMLSGSKFDDLSRQRLLASGS